jgi:hypothetical protein
MTGRLAPARAEAALCFCLFLAVGLILQSLAHAYGNDFGGNADEPAHFVTAMLVRDWLFSSELRHPLAFAKTYYLHYPKLGIGQWPPLFYMAGAGWFLPFGASRASALAFQVAIAALTASVIYLVGSQLLSRAAGMLAALLFLASPLVQETTGRMMTEHLATLLALLSVLGFARFARTGRIRDGLLFGILGAGAILTRGSSWALALVPAIVILLTWRYGLLRRAGLWLAAVPVLIACVPWYALTAGMTRGTWGGSPDGTPYWITASGDFSKALLFGLGPVVLLLAVAGIWAKLVQPFRMRQVSPVWAALFAFAAATWVLLCAVPTGSPSRFMVSLVPVIVLFAAAGVQFLACRFLPAARGAPALYLAVAMVFMVRVFQVPDDLKFSGFRQIVAALASVPMQARRVVLIASDSKGEGAMVAAIAMAEPRPYTYALRGSKILVEEDWLQRSSTERTGGVAEMAALLARIPVDVVVIDASLPQANRRPYHDKLAEAVTQAGAAWRALPPFSVERAGRVFPDALHLYVRGTTPPAAQIDVGLIENLSFTGRAGGVGN